MSRLWYIRFLPRLVLSVLAHLLVRAVLFVIDRFF